MAPAKGATAAIATEFAVATHAIDVAPPISATMKAEKLEYEDEKRVGGGTKSAGDKEDWSCGCGDEPNE